MVDQEAKISIGLTSREIELFKQFRQHQDKIEKIVSSGLLDVIASPNWKELFDYSQKVQFGTMQVTIKDGVPVRVDKPMQQLIFGVIR